MFGDDYEQWDFSSSVNLSQLFNWGDTNVEFTLDGINIFNKRQRSYFQFANATFTDYVPGRQFLVGLRARF